MLVTAILTLGSLLAGEVPGPVASWPQFRGPGGQGVALEMQKLPVHFGPAKNVLWKTALPPGISSPCIWGEHIFLTGFDKDKQTLETICLDRRSGRIRWRRPVAAAKIETVFSANSPATPTPTTDGRNVYVYFGSFGLIAYDFAGKEVWTKPLPIPTTTFGTGTSPVLAGEVLLLTGLGRESFLLAVDCRSGTTLWKKDRPRFGVGYSAPVIRQTRDGTEVLLAGGRGLTAYDLKDGSEKWWMGGFNGGGIPTPVQDHGLVFVVAHFPGGDPDDRMKLPAFDELLQKYDANKDGLLSKEELPMQMILYDRGGHDPLSSITMEDMFPSADRNGDGKIDRKEWEDLGAALARRESSLFVLRPGGRGELPKEQVVWKEKRALPEIPSPLVYQGRLYLVKDGGVASCFDAQTGRLHYRERLGPSGFFYASPVAGDGKIYAASLRGVVAVLQAGDRCEVLAENDLGEAIQATPAIADGKLYVRTEGHLYAFEEK